MGNARIDRIGKEHMNKRWKAFLKTKRAIGPVLLAAALIVIGLWVLNRSWQLNRAESAVRATFPGFCTETGQHLILHTPYFELPILNRRWEVECYPNPSLFAPNSVMLVDLSACSVQENRLPDLESHTFYVVNFSKTPHLLKCP
jgi:hypothetical protein